MLQQLKRVVFWSLVAVAMGSSQAARSEEMGTHGQVLGRARFEKRTSLVPYSVCHYRNCESSHVYWSLVLENEVMRYELSEPFAIGNETAPEAVNLNQVVVRPGSILRIDGTIEEVGRGFAILSEVSEVRLVMDVDILAAEHPMNPGWSCQGYDGDGSPVYVQVWYQCDRAGASYRVRVLTDQRGVLRPVAYVTNAQEVLNHGAVMYTGSHLSTQLELSIVENDATLRDLPSVLKITDTTPQLIDHLRCSRTRNYD
ncbi:MAG: hypothetical protein ACXWPM_12640 [Bdellovibrionota bacterium]